MEGENEKVRDQNEGSGQQQPQGNQAAEKAFDTADKQKQNVPPQQTQGPAGGSEPPRSMGTRGTEFGQSSEEGESGQQGQSATGQADLGSQADTTLAGRADQQDLGRDQPGSRGGQSEGGFVGGQGQDSGEYLQQGGNPESGFAEQGRGASEKGEAERSQDRESDIEGSSDSKR